MDLRAVRKIFRRVPTKDKFAGAPGGRALPLIVSLSEIV